MANNAQIHTHVHILELLVRGLVVENAFRGWPQDEFAPADLSNSAKRFVVCGTLRRPDSTSRCDLPISIPCLFTIYGREDSSLVRHSWLNPIVECSDPLELVIDVASLDYVP